MADVNLTFSKGITTGPNPSSPGFVTGFNPGPVNPTLRTTYLALTDTEDTSYVGKNGFVPVVNGESGLTLEPLPQIEEYRLISGGVVQWTGSGYNFNVSGAIYRIAGVYYESDPDQVTLATPDATNDRIDVIAVDDTGAVVVITGTPSATPVKPQVDPTSQLELTSILVTAASTDPTLTEEVIYDQNTEWTGSSSGTGTANFASTTDPYQGSVSVETTNIQNGFYIQFNNGSTVDVSTFQTIGFFIKLKASLPANQNLFISFLDGSAVSASNNVLVNLDKSNTSGYQFIGIALNTINFTSFDIQYVRFTFVRNSGAQTYSGYFLDVVKFEGGINPPIGVNTFIALQDTPISYSGQGGKVVAVKSDESGLEFVSGGGGGGITGSGTTNEIAYFTGATAITSLSTATYPSLTELSYVKGVTSSIQTQLNAKPTTFLGLTDTPSAYTSQANKWVRVNGTPDALIFDTISPYDLDQEGASDGQVLAWSTANSRYEPVTPSGGSSLWTDATTFIYRDGPVVVGGTTWTSNSALEITSVGIASASKVLHVKNNAGTDILNMRQDGLLWVGNPTTGTASSGPTFKGAVSSGGEIFKIQNSTNQDCFVQTGNGDGKFLRNIITGAATTNLANFGSTFKGQVANDANQVFRVLNSSNTILFEIAGLGQITYRDGGNHVFGTTTGSKLGTATSQKIGFWNATPIIQPTTAVTSATFVANTSGIANDTATFDGYTIGQVVKALRNMGLLA